MLAKTTLVYVGGLGQSPFGNLCGFRPFGERMEAEYGAYFVAFSHAMSAREIASLIPIGREIVAACHSNGADEWAFGVQVELAKQVRMAAAVCYLDAKPEWNRNWGLFRWLNKDYKYPVPAARSYIAYHGGFGCGLTDPSASVRLDIPHDAFPAHHDPQRWIEDRIKEIANGLGDFAVA